MPELLRHQFRCVFWPFSRSSTHSFNITRECHGLRRVLPVLRSACDCYLTIIWKESNYTISRMATVYRCQSETGFYFEREYRQPVRGEGNVDIRGGGVMKVKLFPPPFPLLGDSLLFKICPIFTCPTEQLVDLQHSARFVAEDQIDLALCRQWLQDCEEHHPGICRDYSMLEREQPLPSGFRLIDVVNQCVSREPLTSRYIALSYVVRLVVSLRPNPSFGRGRLLTSDSSSGAR